MDRFNLAQLTKVMLAARLKEVPDLAEATRQVVHETLKTYLRNLPPGSPELKEGVREVARGAVTALLIRDQRLPRGTVHVLKGVELAAASYRLDPSEALAWALEGIADLKRFVPLDALLWISQEIEREFMGTGEAFRACLDRVPELDRRPEKRPG
jgi:hypothetical protein